MVTQIQTPQETILIVDDDANNLRLLFDFLNRANFKTLVAENGVSALNLVDQQLPDLILLDVVMPDIDGVEICRRLKMNDATKDIPVIFMTGLSETQDILTGFEAGGVDYVVKPFHVTEVLARINAHLTIRRLQAQLQQQNNLLEQRVEIRTGELAQANKILHAEIEQREIYQQEKDKLFDVVRQQNEQLRVLTNLLLDTRQNDQHNFAQSLCKQFIQQLDELSVNFNQLQYLLSVHTLELTNAKPLHDKLESSIEMLARIQDTVTITVDNFDQLAPEQPVTVRLSNREKEVLQFLIDGHSPAEIADILFISAKTVYTYRQRLMSKLGVNTLAGLIRYTLQHNVTPPE